MSRFQEAVLTMLALASCAHLPPAPSRASTVVFIARAVRTMDPRRPVVQALAMKDGAILAVGTRDEVLAAAGPDAIVETFPTSTIVPGLIDSHGHLELLGKSLAEVSLEGARSEAEAAALAGKAERAQGWVLGHGWDQNRWSSTAFPTAKTLDAVLPDAPAMLTRVDGHAAWVNSEALRRAQLTAATPDPPGGRLERDATGAPTGVLVDAAMDLMTKVLPAPSVERRERWLKLALERCASVGLTQVHDAGMELETFKLLQHWDLLRVLPVRVYAMAWGQGADAEQYLGLGRFKGDKLELRAVKFILDGALGSRGAALFEPYLDDPAQRGLLLLSAEELEARARPFADAGFQVAVHAIGDRANRLVLDVLSRLEAAHPGSRHRVEHAQLLTAEDLPRFARAHLIASLQPTHATSDAPWAEARVGAERLRFAYAWKSLLESGARVTFGSDFPIEDPNPLWGLYAARTREDRSGQPPGGWHPEQKVDGAQALAAFTTAGAYASFAEGERGRLAPGLDADFVVLPVDPVVDPPRALLEARVQVTVVGGVDVYRAP